MAHWCLIDTPVTFQAQRTGRKLLILDNIALSLKLCRDG
jgi:hypothetical protein